MNGLSKINTGARNAWQVHLMIKYAEPTCMHTYNYKGVTSVLLLYRLLYRLGADQHRQPPHHPLSKLAELSALRCPSGTRAP